MSEYNDENTTSTSIDLESAMRFLKRYHPNLWERMETRDIAKVLELSHIMFVTCPNLLAATTDLRQVLPTQ